MALPENNPALEMLLRSLTLQEPKESSKYQSIVAVDPMFGNDMSEAGTPVDVFYPECKLWFCESEAFSFDALSRKLEQELLRKHHPHTEKVIRVLLAAYCLEPERHSAPIHCPSTLVETTHFSGRL